jgi:hypothetical protein
MRLRALSCPRSVDHKEVSGLGLNELRLIGPALFDQRRRLELSDAFSIVKKWRALLGLGFLGSSGAHIKSQQDADPVVAGLDGDWIEHEHCCCFFYFLHTLLEKPPTFLRWRPMGISMGGSRRSGAETMEWGDPVVEEISRRDVGVRYGRNDRQKRSSLLSVYIGDRVKHGRPVRKLCPGPGSALCRQS